MAATGEKYFSWGSQVYMFTEIVHTSGTSSTFKVPQTASAVVGVAGDNTAPSASLGSADSNGEKTVTLTGGQSGTFYVITRHPNGLASNVRTS